jgi:hypothetical protein
MAISDPRKLRNWAGGNPINSFPKNLIDPAAILPGGVGINPIRDSAVMDLPHPLSPTMPNVSP